MKEQAKQAGMIIKHTKAAVIKPDKYGKPVPTQSAAVKAALRKKQQADDPPPGLQFSPAALKLGIPEIINAHVLRVRFVHP